MQELASCVCYQLVICWLFFGVEIFTSPFSFWLLQVINYPRTNYSRRIYGPVSNWGLLILVQCSQFIDWHPTMTDCLVRWDFSNTLKMHLEFDKPASERNERMDILFSFPFINLRHIIPWVYNRVAHERLSMSSLHTQLVRPSMKISASPCQGSLRMLSHITHFGRNIDHWSASVCQSVTAMGYVVYKGFG